MIPLNSFLSIIMFCLCSSQIEAQSNNGFKDPETLMAINTFKHDYINQNVDFLKTNNEQLVVGNNLSLRSNHFTHCMGKGTLYGACIGLAFGMLGAMSDDGNSLISFPKETYIFTGTLSGALAGFCIGSLIGLIPERR